MVSSLKRKREVQTRGKRANLGGAPNTRENVLLHIRHAVFLANSLDLRSHALWGLGIGFRVEVEGLGARVRI